MGGALVVPSLRQGRSSEVSSFERDAARELGVSPPFHSWRETLQGESPLLGCCELRCMLCGVVFVSVLPLGVVSAILDVVPTV